MEGIGLETLLQNRRSIRRFQDKEVPDEVLREALTLATLAPSGNNRQPWFFLVVKNQEVKDKMADLVRERLELLLSWPEGRAKGEALSGYARLATFFRQAPVCIAVFMGEYQSLVDQVLAARGEGDPEAKAMMEARRAGGSRLQSVAGAIGYLLLALEEKGLGACWMTGPLVAKATLEELLPGPPGHELVALIPVGYPDESPAPRPRKSLEEVVCFID